MTTGPVLRGLVPLPPPPPGLHRLRRRLADRDAFRDAVLAAVSETPDPDAGAAGDLGARLDVAGDPTLLAAAQAWARVADSVAAYTEMTAGETYLGTAQDWTDLRRIVDLIGYRPAQRTAARGWLRVDTEPGANPMLPAGTKIQAPPVPGRAAQTFQVLQDTQLRADWRAFTATGAPRLAAPGHQLRFIHDPGIAPPDRVLLVSETTDAPPPALFDTGRGYSLEVSVLLLPPTRTVGVIKVTSRADDLGAYLIGFDRSLAPPLLVTQPGTTYALYRIRQELTVATRLTALSYVKIPTVGEHAASAVPTDRLYPPQDQALVSSGPGGQGSVLVTDGSAVSKGQRLAVFGGTLGQCTITTVDKVSPVDWQVAPGTTSRVTRLTCTGPLPAGLSAVTVMLIDDRVVVQHYDLPDIPAPPAAPAPPPARTLLRIHPRPAQAPTRLAVQTTDPQNGLRWETTTCWAAAEEEPAAAGAARGMLLELDPPLTGRVSRSSATGNVAPIVHGTTTSAALTVTGGSTVVPGPVTGDSDAHGAVTNSLTVQVDGVRYDEQRSLYRRGPGDLVYATRLAADGGLILGFGDGTVGAEPTGAVTGTWRIGGGLDGELADGDQISTLLGRVPGVRAAAGVGPTTGAADQEDQQRIRHAAGASIRALNRAVSVNDLADLALTVPGTSHSVVWRGAPPDGAAGPAEGVKVAVLRRTSTGVRPPLDAELTTLTSYLNARRDTSVPLSVYAARVTEVTVQVTVDIDPRRDPATVDAAVKAAVLNPQGELAPTARALGQPLDVSDILAVMQPVTGVVGISRWTVTAGSRTATAGERQLGRLSARPYELLAITTVAVTTRTVGTVP